MPPIPGPPSPHVSDPTLAGGTMGARPAAAPFALEVLEFPAVRALLARYTSFSRGRDLALALHPCHELAEAERRQSETAEALRLPGLRPSLHFGGVHDVRPQVDRARIGSALQPGELREVAGLVRAARAWRQGLRGLTQELPTLLELAGTWLSDHVGLAEDIEAAIGEDGQVLDSASPALSRIRGELRGAHDRLVARLRELMNTPAFRDAVQDPVVTQRAGRYVIPIRAEARTQVPAIVHDQSASGATLFVEPLAAVELANRWRTLLVEEEEEVERILRALSRAVGDEAEALVRSVDGLARLDLARAKARLAEGQRAIRPRLLAIPAAAGQPVLRLLQARHPLLLARGGPVVPVDLELGGEFDTLLITGPNTGGKTVALKTAGVLALMAQAGLHVPAAQGSCLAVFARVQADIGDEQSLEQSLSTFSSHVTRIVRMLGQADRSSLVLLDELGAGTDPQEGAALARAILDHLRTLGAYVIATTHYPELKAYAHVTPRVENASVEFDLRTLSPTYRLLVGTPGRSNALAIAQRLGMAQEILQGARAYLSPRTLEVDAVLQEIEHERLAAEQARQRIDLDREGARRMLRQAHAALRDAERKRKQIWDDARAVSQAELSELRREALRVRQQIGVGRASAGEVREAIQAALDLPPLHVPPPPRLEMPNPSEAEPPRVPLEEGAEVLVPRLAMPGRILSVRDGSVELEVLGRRVRMAVADLEDAPRTTAAERRTAGPAEPRDHPPRVVLATPRGDVSVQLDLRGLRRDEALERLERYLEDAMLSGLSHARIVHGKGTGAVRQAVRETLRGSRFVSRYEPERDPHGGDGATLAWFAS